MSSPRFYCATPLSANQQAILPENVARHAIKVLRLRIDDEITLFDGTGGEYPCRIAMAERERVLVDVGERLERECEAPIRVTLVQAVQSGEKMDLTVQKAVELGMTRFVPVISRRSLIRLAGERAERRVEHWRSVAISACEQCGRNRVPEVDALEGLERWLGKPVEPNVLRLMLDPRSPRTLNQIEQPAVGGQIELLIGAEGGLAPEEIERAAQAGFISVRLGPRVLRTETAGMTALAVIGCLWGDLREETDHV